MTERGVFRGDTFATVAPKGLSRRQGKAGVNKSVPVPAIGNHFTVNVEDKFVTALD